MTFYRLGTLLLLLCPCFAQPSPGCDGGGCPAQSLDRRAELEVDEHAALQTRTAAGHGSTAGSSSGAEEGVFLGGGAAGRHPPLSGHCLKYSVTVPTFSQSGELASEVAVGYTLADVATVAQPATHSKRRGTVGIPYRHNGHHTPRGGNSMYDGFRTGMFSIFFIREYPMGDVGRDANFTVFGLMPNSAYISVEVSYGSGLTERVSYSGSALKTFFADGSPAPNPFMPGNPTVLAYPQQAHCAQQTGVSLDQAGHALVETGSQSSQGGQAMPVLQQQQQQEQQQAGDEAELPEAFTLGCEPTNTSVYRLSELASSAMEVDGGAEGSCSSTYLYAPATTETATLYIPTLSHLPTEHSYVFKYGFIKMKVPNAFNNFKELTFKGMKSPENPDGYDAQAFTVSSNWMLGPSPEVPFGISSLMLLERGFNIKGVAIILFAPAEAVKALSKPNAKLPPVVYIPRLKLKAYLLVAPNFAFIFRYRGASEHWKGSPGNAECHSTVLASLEAPATCQQLGDSLPQITRVDGVHDIAGLVERI